MTDGRAGEFDIQADVFDDRAGIGDRVARTVAQAVNDLSGVRCGEILLEIGAGTGEIGMHLARGAGRYIAIDSSSAMLTAAAWGKIERRVVADCDERWPIADASVRCVFAARVTHLLDVSHLLAELTRVGCDDGLCFIVGRTRRAKDGFKELLRDRMRQSLTDRGIQPREGRSKIRNLIETMTAAGAIALEPVDAADWRTRGTPREVLDAWRRKPRLGGAEVDAATREAVLAEVADWAVQQFGDLDAALESRETYTLREFRLKNSLREVRSDDVE